MKNPVYDKKGVEYSFGRVIRNHEKAAIKGGNIYSYRHDGGEFETVDDDHITYRPPDPEDTHAHLAVKFGRRNQFKNNYYGKHGFRVVRTNNEKSSQ